MNDRLPEESRELERHYAELSWPVPSRDVVREALVEARPTRFPTRTVGVAVAAALVLLLCGWWLTQAPDAANAAALAWEGDTELAADLEQLQTRMKRGRSHAALSMPEEDSISSRTAVLRRRVNRLKQNLEPIPPKTGVPVGTYGGTEDENEIA